MPLRYRMVTGITPTPVSCGFSGVDVSLVREKVGRVLSCARHTRMSNYTDQLLADRLRRTRKEPCAPTGFSGL